MRPASDDLISWIVPVYNGERYLSEALDSILSAHAQNFWIPELRGGEARYRDHARVQAVPSLNCCRRPRVSPHPQCEHQPSERVGVP